MELTGPGGEQINLLVILIIVLVLILIFRYWATKIRAKKVKDRSAESSTSAHCKICGQDNPPEARFCANCGAVLVATAELPSPGAQPSAPLAQSAVAVEYIGSNTRLGAAIIDWAIVYVILLVCSWPTGFYYGPTLISVFWSFPLLSVYHWLFTGLKGQTPGKMVLRIKVVDAQGNRPTLRIAALREVLGKLISTAGLCLGFACIDRDKQKRGWHDIIAKTRVVKVIKGEIRGVGGGL